jgi:hypothetical protein
MKYLNLFLIPLFIFSISACSSSKWTEVNDPLHSLIDESNQLIEKGAVAAVGEGRSTRRDIAKQKAVANAELNLASIFERKVQGIKKNFQEEVGQGHQSEVNELFSVVSKTLIKKTLTGAYQKDYKILKNDKGEYLYGVLLTITPKTANMTILDEMKAKKPQLYQRFRASKAFKELQKEMENFDK